LGPSPRTLTGLAVIPKLPWIHAIKHDRAASRVMDGSLPRFPEVTNHDDRPRCAVVMARRRETLMLSLPADPALARLARLVSSHFFRQNGLTAAAARRGARAVEKRCRPILRAAARGAPRRGPALVLVLRPQSAMLEVVGRAAGRPGAFSLRLARGGTSS